MGLQLGMDGSSVFDLGNRTHSILVPLQLLAERGGGLAQVFDCGVQVLDRVQRMGFQILDRLHDLGKVTGSTFYLRLARPIAALLIAEVEVVHQQIGQCWLFRFFQSVQKKLLLFIQICDPALQPTDGVTNGLHQAVGGANVPVEVSEKSFDSSLLHLMCRRAKMHGRYLLHSLTLKTSEGQHVQVCQPLPDNDW